MVLVDHLLKARTGEDLLGEIEKSALLPNCTSEGETVMEELVSCSGSVWRFTQHMGGIHGGARTSE